MEALTEGTKDFIPSESSNEKQKWKKKKCATIANTVGHT